MKDRDFYSNINIPLPNIDWQNVWGDSLPGGITTPRWKPITELTNIWPKEIHEKFKSIGLRLSMARVFKWHSQTFFPWHIDGNEKGTTKCALNWVVQGNGVIQWNDSMMIGLELEDRKEIVIKTKIKGYTPMVNELYKFDCELTPKTK